MKSSLLQTQIKLNADVLTGLHQEYNNLRKSRKMYNERADECFRQMMISDEQLDFDASHQHATEGEANREQALVFTPYIKKFARKIKAIEQVQKAMKHEVKCVACLEAWNAEPSDAEWLELARLVDESGVRVTYSYEDAAKIFGGE